MPSEGDGVGRLCDPQSRIREQRDRYPREAEADLRTVNDGRGAHQPFMVSVTESHLRPA